MTGGPAIGFIGLGAMGGPMCRRLVQHAFSVIVYDAVPEAIAALTQAGAAQAASPAEVGQRSEIVLMSLPNSSVIEDLVLGEGGLAEAMQPGSVLVDLSSARPASTRRIAAALAERGVGCIDAPVSRGVSAAESGTLSIIAGGAPEVVARCRPVLDVLGTTVLHVGQVGSGHSVKCLNNLVAGANFVAANEIVLIASRLGLDPWGVADAINANSGRSWQLSDRIPRFVLTRSFDSNFSLGNMYKDIRTAIELAEEADVRLFATDVARQVYSLALSAGQGSDDSQTVALQLECMLGQSLSGEPSSEPGSPTKEE